jgi:hypothetical protein
VVSGGYEVTVCQTNCHTILEEAVTSTAAAIKASAIAEVIISEWPLVITAVVAAAVATHLQQLLLHWLLLAIPCRSSLLLWPVAIAITIHYRC